jgi:hypothetical protein
MVAFMMLFHVRPLNKWSVCAYSCVSTAFGPCSTIHLQLHRFEQAAPSASSQRLPVYYRFHKKIWKHAERAIQAFKGVVCPDGSPSRTGCVLP